MASDKDVEKLRKTTYEKICQLFDMLLQEGLLIKNSDIISQNFQNIFKRISEQQVSLNNKIGIFENKEKLSKFLEVNKEFGITADSFTFELKCDMAQFLHSEKEMLARQLSHMLDCDKLHIDRDKPMLGTILHKIGEHKNSLDKKIFLESGLRDVFHVDMRNVLGHDNWWFNDQGNFCYPNEEPYDFPSFAGELVATSLVMEAVNVKYLEKFFPESLENVKKIISKIG